MVELAVALAICGQKRSVQEPLTCAKLIYVVHMCFDRADGLLTKVVDHYRLVFGNSSIGSSTELVRVSLYVHQPNNRIIPTSFFGVLVMSIFPDMYGRHILDASVFVLFGYSLVMFCCCVFLIQGEHM